MPNPEIFQAAANLAHQAKEAINFASQANLSQTLTELGHPYGLLIGQANTSSSVDVEFINSLREDFFPPEKGEAKAMLKSTNGVSLGKNAFVISIPCCWPILSIGILGGSFKSGMPFLYGVSLNTVATAVGSNLIEIGKNTSRSKNREYSSGYLGSVLEREEHFSNVFAAPSGLATTSLSKGSILGSAKHNPDFARKIHMDGLLQQAFLAPILLKAMAGEKESQERTRQVEISRASVGLGTTCIKLTTFRGEKPFVIKTPQGEAIAEINPGDQLGHLHVSHQAAFMRELTPLGKSQRIIEDFIDLFKFIDQGGNFGLDQKQQETINRASNATLIGISHLVRLFRRRTGLPTWKLDVLPELVQRFHQHDYQAVSRAFGGTRKVKPKDVEMMAITPAMRQQLIATI